MQKTTFVTGIDPQLLQEKFTFHSFPITPEPKHNAQVFKNSYVLSDNRDF